MTQEEFLAAARACTHSLEGHVRRSAKERMQEIADSPYAEIRMDHYGNGGFVNEFENEVAALLGKEAAVFMPSGTMAQQIALRIWADRANNKNTAFHPMCHLEKHEHMAYHELHHLDASLLGEPDRLFTFDDLKGVQKELGSLLIEFPQRDLGGRLPTWEEFQAIVAYANSQGIKLHLDGARLWECQPYFGRSYAEICADFDSVYVSCYKVLDGLPGAVLAAPADFISEARTWMRRHGGNLVYMFPNAISAKIGMDRNLPRIAEYVTKAAEIAAILNSLQGVTVIPERPPTNMMHLQFEAPKQAIMDAVGEIALREKVLLFSRVGDTGRTEMYIGDAGAQIPGERIRELCSEMLEIAGKNSGKTEGQ